ncbi:MAG: hydrogenase formation protein HypD [Calditerrivibrio sp.]|nr:hydrogenase formation protein HypD [Calditerrivibrio sp.]
MELIENFRRKSIVKILLRKIEESLLKNQTYKIMEICGTHTVSISRFGIRSLLPKDIQLISGPGCPVCVTSQGEIDSIFSLINQKDLIIAVYGDLMRVPGSDGKSLLDYRGMGADIVVVNSVLDIIKLAKSTDKNIVFVSIGFETTTPQTAYLILESQRLGLSNLSVLLFNKTMPEVISLILKDKNLKIDGFLCPGHVTTVTGVDIYTPMIKNNKAAVVTGFEPVDILQSILTIVEQVNSNNFSIVNNYKRVASGEKNEKALSMIEKVFCLSDADWRGIGTIKGSGLRIREEFEEYDASKKFDITFPKYTDKYGCRCGDVLKGYITPKECKMFGDVCTPENPFGPCMVSNEGTCAAYYQFGGEIE